MTEHSNDPGTAAKEPVASKPIFTATHLASEITLLVLLGASYAGVAIADIAPAHAHGYWLFMVALFFVASLVAERPNVRAGKYPWANVLWTQLAQWLALGVGVQMVFIIQQIGRLSTQATVLVLLLVFALATFIAGIRMGWLFRLTGLFLAASLLVLAYMERYLWLLVLLGLLLLAGQHYLARYLRARKPGGVQPET